MTLNIRAATAADANAICTIHNQGIADRVATLDTTLRTPDDTATGSRRAARATRSSSRKSTTRRRASLNPFNARSAYDHVADFSVYVERAWRGQGVAASSWTR